MSWDTEHGKDYKVPRAICGFYEDVSWHNDACPSFTHKGDKSQSIRLWIEHPNRNQRETGPGGTRYWVASEHTIVYETNKLADAIIVMDLMKPLVGKTEDEIEAGAEVLSVALKRLRI